MLLNFFKADCVHVLKGLALLCARDRPGGLTSLISLSLMLDARVPGLCLHAEFKWHTSAAQPVAVADASKPELVHTPDTKLADTFTEVYLNTPGAARASAPLDVSIDASVPLEGTLPAWEDSDASDSEYTTESGASPQASPQHARQAQTAHAVLLDEHTHAH